MSLLRIARDAVRLWTRIYTRGLPRELGQRRRAEIESDLFEQIAEAGADRRTGLRILWRLLAGIHQDLIWRGESVGAMNRMQASRLAAIVMTLMGVLAVWTWLGAGVQPPEPPKAPRYRSRVDLRPMPPPPPPPPPLCTPPRVRSSTPCTPWP
jgi:hypothetical protein